jgi:hypothetical protein
MIGTTENATNKLLGMPLKCQQYIAIVRHNIKLYCNLYFEQYIVLQYIVETIYCIAMYNTI